MSGDAVMFVFQNDPAVPRVTLRPVRLDERALYVITHVDGTRIGNADGAALMTNGIEVETSPESSAHILLLQKTQAAAAAVRAVGR